MSTAPRKEQDEREHCEDAYADQREGADEDREDRDEHHERLRDGGDPSALAHCLWPQAIAEPEVAEHDDGGDGEREQPRDRADEEEDAFDDGDPERDRQASLSEPGPRAALAMFDDRGLEHAATLPSRLREPGRPARGHQLARLDGAV